MIRKPNLATMSFFQVKKLAKELQGKTNETLAEEIGVGHEHVSRHFRDPHYSVSPAMLPALCRAMDNYLQIEWLVIQVGATMTMLDRTKLEDMIVSSQVSRTLKEASDVLQVWSDCMLDGVRTSEEENQLDRELCQLVARATAARDALRMGGKAARA